MELLSHSGKITTPVCIPVIFVRIHLSDGVCRRAQHLGSAFVITLISLLDGTLAGLSRFQQQPERYANNVLEQL